MPYQRKTQTFEIWTAIEAGIIEDTQRHLMAQAQLKIITETTPSPAETGARLLFPLMACVTPEVTWEEFVNLPSRVLDGITRAVVAVNPEWDATGILSEKKSDSKPSDGTPSLQPTTKAARKRHNSPQK